MKSILLFITISSLTITSSRVIGLQGIRSKIDQAFYTSFAETNSKELTSIAGQLKQDGSPLAIYWYVYVKYYESIFCLQTKDAVKSEKAVNEGIEALSMLENKNSEDYALLVILQTLICILTITN